jgi:hypothetical protein
MGVVDSIKNLLAGSARTFVDVPLMPGEEVVLDKYGGLIVHGISWKGGQIRLTNMRLLLLPWNMADVSALLKAGLKVTGAPSQAIALVGWMQGQLSPEVNALDVIESVALGGGPSLTRAPSIVVRLRDGRTLELGVVASPTTLSLSKKNVQHRDELFSALRALKEEQQSM